MSCAQCKFWKESSSYNKEDRIDAENRYGKCGKIREHIEIELRAGWDGAVVEYIETYGDFCCNKFQKK